MVPSSKGQDIGFSHRRRGFDFPQGLQRCPVRSGESWLSNWAVNLVAGLFYESYVIAIAVVSLGDARSTPHITLVGTGVPVGL